MMTNIRLARITTVPISLKKLLTGQLKFMSQQNFEVIAISAPGKILHEIQAHENVKIKSIVLTRKITPLTDLWAILQLSRYLLRKRPAIVHTHTPKAGLIGMIAAWLCRVPIRLHTVAGLPQLENSGIKRRVLDITEKITYACAQRVYPNSFKMKDIILKNRYCKLDKLKVIGNGSSNGIDTTYFDPSLFSDQSKAKLKKKLNIYPDEIVLSFIGRVVKDKGIRELTESFLNLIIDYPNLKLIIVGPFEKDLDALDKATEDAILNNPNIIFTDYQEDVRPYLAISDIFAFPSYREGFPNVVMQAGAMGVPCIVSNINGCNEIIEDKKNGLIVPVKDSPSLQTAIETLIGNRFLLKQMASISRPMIVKRYDQQFFWNELLKEYEELLKNSNNNLSIGS